MKTFEEFKTRFENGEFDEQFKEVSSPEDVVEFAKDLGYEITLEDISSAELDEDKLHMVAGGKKDTTTTVNYNTRTEGNYNTTVTFNQ